MNLHSTPARAALALAATAALGASLAACSPAQGTGATPAGNAPQTAAQGPTAGSALPGITPARTASPGELADTRAQRQAAARNDTWTTPCTPAAGASAAIGEGVPLASGHAPVQAPAREGDSFDVCIAAPDGSLVMVDGRPVAAGADGVYRAPVPAAFATSYGLLDGAAVAPQDVHVCVSGACTAYQVTVYPRQP